MKNYATIVIELILMKNKKFFKIFHRDASTVIHIYNLMRDALRHAIVVDLKNL